MKRLERERLEALEKASAEEQQTLESDTALQNLDEVETREKMVWCYLSGCGGRSKHEVMTVADEM